MIAKIFFLSLALVCFSSLSCNLLVTPEKPKGTSIFSATVGGIPTSFPSITSFPDDGGFIIIAKAPKDTIFFKLGNNKVGKYFWNGHKNSNIWDDTVAEYNSLWAISGIGGLTIATSDDSLQRIVGTFAFAVVDTIKLDSIRISDGSFDIYWTY